MVEITWSIFILIVLLRFLFPATLAAKKAPYPPSPVIKEVKFLWSTHERFAQGSDNWQLTWADDNHQYAPWGDGGGFGGTNSDGRVSLGVARVEGPWNDYQGFNVWGGIPTCYQA